MISVEKLIPVIAAVISATALLGGYMYQKNQEREAEIRKMRQEIYSDLINNITGRDAIIKRLQMSSASQKPLDIYQLYNAFISDAEGAKNSTDQKKIGAFLTLYGTDDAIRAYASYLEEGMEEHGSKGADLGKLIVGLRKSVYQETKTTTDDANLIIFNNREYLKPSATK